MANNIAPRDANQMPTMLGVDDVTGLPVPVAVDSNGNVLVIGSASSGDVSGPASSTDNAIARFDGATGKIIQNSTVIIADTTGNISGVQQLTLGVAGSGTGKLLVKGTTSGTVTIQSADAAGTYTLTLPTDDGTPNQVLSTDGSGVLSWVNAGGVPTTITVADEAADTTCFPLFVTAATGDLGPKTNAVGLKFNSNTGALAATSLVPSANDSGALGTGTLMWSDLFLADGSVINWNNGDLALTHTANTLTLTGGNLVGLGATTATTFNGLAITANGTNTLNIAAGKTLIVSNSITLAGTDSTVMTFPSTSATIARTDAANTFTGASTASAWVLTSPTITTKISPTSDDGAPLGDTTHNFSDLFLASGAVTNYANGNVVLTHSSGILTMGTGDLRVASANVGTNADSVPTLSSTSTLTNKTLTSPTLTTPSAFTTGGSITLAENSSIALDPAGSADGKFTGTTVTATAGYTQAFGDLVYLDPTDSRWEATDANSAAGADGDARGILGMVVVAGTDGNPCTILLNGIIRADAKFPTFTVNNPIYVSETAGLVTQTQPTTTDVVIRFVGDAITADEMFFNPDRIWFTHI